MVTSGAGIVARAKGSLKRCLQLLWPEIPARRDVAGGIVEADMSCVRCGHCCCYLLVKLNTGDIRLLARGLGLSNREALRRYVRMTSIGPVLRQTNDRCVFLDGREGKDVAVCRVYALRPEACRRWAPSTSRLECQEGVRERQESKPAFAPRAAVSP